MAVLSCFASLSYEVLWWLKAEAIFCMTALNVPVCLDFSKTINYFLLYLMEQNRMGAIKFY